MIEHLRLLFNLFASIFSVVFYGIYYVIQKPSGVFFIKPEYIGQQLWLLSTIVIAVLLWGIVARFRFTVVANVDVSITQILTTLRTVIFVAIGYLLYKNPFNMHQLLALLLVIVANLLLISKIDLSSLHKKGFQAFVIVQITSLVALSLEPSFLGKVNILIYTLMVWGFKTIAVYVAPHLKRIDISRAIKSIGLIKIMFLAFIKTLSYYIYLVVLKILNVSVVGIAIQISPVFIVFGGIFWLKEKEHLGHKIISIILVTLGLVLLRLGA